MERGGIITSHVWLTLFQYWIPYLFAIETRVCLSIVCTNTRCCAKPNLHPASNSFSDELQISWPFS